jgi:hypothetical protein
MIRAWVLVGVLVPALATAQKKTSPGKTTSSSTTTDTTSSTSTTTTTTSTTTTTTSTTTGPCAGSYKRLVDVKTASELKSALTNAQPGDQIRLADGVYSGAFSISKSGTSAAPITLCGSRSAVLDAGGANSNVLSVSGANYWIIEGIQVRNGLRGIYLTGSNHNLVRSVEIHSVRQAAFHFRSNSKHNTLLSSIIYETGLEKDTWGEGVYFGTAITQWVDGIPDRSDSNKVINNTIGPNVRAEAIDVKEGVTGGWIQGNTIYGAGSAEDDIMDLRGNGLVISGNTISVSPGHGIRIQATTSGTGWAANNLVSENVIDLHTDKVGVVVGSTGGTGNVIKCNNKVTNAGTTFRPGCTN